MSTIIFLNDYTNIRKYTRYGKEEAEETNNKKNKTATKLKKILKEFQTNDEKASKQKVSVVDVGKSDSLISLFNNSGYMEQYVGILYYKDKTEEYYLSIRSRFDEKNGFFTEYILSKVLETCGYPFNEGLFREGDLSSALKRLMEIAFLMLIDKYYSADAIRDSDLGNEVNQLILLTYRRFHSKDNLEWDSSWVDGIVESHPNLKNYIDRMNDYWKKSHLPDVNTLLNSKKCDNKGWEKVRQTACMIQHYMNSKNSDKRMAGVLFDMNDLWELYLENVLRERTTGSEYRFFYQKEVDILLPFEKKEYGKKTIRPDFCFKTRSRYSMVLDAKNKISWANIVKADGEDPSDTKTWKEEGYLREDIFEVLTYMFALGSPIGGIVCPVKLSEEKEYKPVSYRISNYEGGEFFVAGLPTNCPPELLTDFEGYKKIMREREEALWKNIIDADCR